MKKHPATARMRKAYGLPEEDSFGRLMYRLYQEVSGQDLGVEPTPQAYPETFPTEMSTEGKDMQESDSSSAGGLGFFGAIGEYCFLKNATGTASENEDSYVDISSGIDDKKRKLAKRLIDMTNKIEELSNQIYHLQQRIEVLEKRSGISGY